MFGQIPDLFVEVVIPLALPKNYTWAVPAHLQQQVQPGVRVEVVLGKHKKYAGIVKKVIQQAPDRFKPKEIIQVLDSTPIVHEQQLQFWEWIAAYYLCSEGEVMQAAVPANLKLSSESILVWNEGGDYTPEQLTDEEYIVTEALELKRELKLSEVQNLLSVTHVYPVIKRLIEKDVCYVWEELKERYKPKKEKYILLQDTYKDEAKLEELLNNWSRAPKQMELLLAYLHLQQTEHEVTQTNLLKKANATSAQLKGLIEKQVLKVVNRNIDRIQRSKAEINSQFELSTAQINAKEAILSSFKSKDVCLLHGITGSGKTQIYIQLIEEQIQQGKQVLFMLPEIALTAQIIRRLEAHFGGHIGIYHSKFNDNERVEIWQKVCKNELKVVLGARSAALLPFTNLGLVIIDEEHDPSFKQQDPAPRYQARDAAIFLANLFKAKVLLGSGTPSIESRFNAAQQKYGYVSLTERFGEGELPSIEIVDMKPFLKGKAEAVLISPALQEKIAATLTEKKQVILFQNRRGYAPYLICQTCGWIPQCEHCDVTLTYHKAKHKLACHYCGTTYPPIQTCVACGSHQFVQRNFGTEKIEEAVLELFPDARVARMDHDTVKGKHDHDTIIRQFEDQKIDILIGTQMVVKGLDFAHVNLVGIIDADGL
ncbi:MAG TPA: primosomal protein N', partial [Chitinophagaceae bacterium]|nr:primosomal protein N' [Chitinophagaceae bacterium]